MGTRGAWFIGAGVLVAGLWWMHSAPPHATASKAASQRSMASVSAPSGSAAPAQRSPSASVAPIAPSTGAQTPTVTAAAGSPSSALLQRYREIEDTVKCYETRTCPFPQTDPRSYEYGVGFKLRELLNKYSEDYKDDPQAQQMLAVLARQFVRSLDGNVQNAALNIMKYLPPSPENYKALADSLSNNPDATYVQSVLDEMKKYIGTPQEPAMQALLGQLIATGPHFSSQAVATHILPFINSRSYPSYRQLAEQMPSQSRAGRDLTSAVHEYERLQTGG